MCGYARDQGRTTRISTLRPSLSRASESLDWRGTPICAQKWLHSEPSHLLSQIPESHLDTANHMDSNSHRHHHHDHLAISSSLHQNTITPTPNNQTQSNNIHQPFSREKSDYSSKKYSATGGTGGLSSTVHRKIKMPTKVLGDYQLQLVNKAFLNF